MTFLRMPLGASAWIVSEATMERFGWVLLHSLWQFLLIAILALVVLRFLKRSSASLRYVILVFTMAACAVLPVVTWFSQPTDPTSVITAAHRESLESFPMEPMPSPLGAGDEAAVIDDEQVMTAELPAVSKPSSIESSAPVSESADWWVNARDSLRPWLMSIVTTWIIGVTICALRPLLSWIAIRRWRRVGTTPVSQEVTELMLRLSDRLAVRRSVEILQSSLVHVPLVFGCLRPLILLPASLLTNLPTSQLEAIIAHELAHVRRHDFLVNFMQTIIETLFFYHPAIWWLSHRIRIERENCCDDLVVSVLCNRVDYGRALLAVEEDLGFASTLALGARGGSLLARVQRLAGLQAARRRPVASVAAMITSGLLIAGTAFMIGSLLLAAGDDSEAQFGKASNGLQIRLVPLASDVSDETPEVQRLASSFKRSQEMTFAVQLKNVSREPITLAGIRYGQGFAPETRGKLNTAMLAPHWFEFEFTDTDGKRLLRTPHREFYQGWYHADNASVHVLAPGESLIEVLRPAKFMQPMDYELLPGKYRVKVLYRGPNDSLREFVGKHWPGKPILNAWPHHATSNVSDFAIEEASNRTKPEELIWGKPVEGLQAALEYRLPDDAKGNPLIAPGVAVGSQLGITFHLRNVSDNPITFVSETGRQGDRVQVTDETGKEVEVQSAFFSGEPIDVAWKLMPGEVAQLSVLTPGLGSLDKPGKYKVRYTVRFNSRIQKDEVGNVIFPRPGDYDKEVETGETPLFLHDPKDDLSANRDTQPDGSILDGVFRDEINLKLSRGDAHQGKWYFVDLDQGKLKTPPFDVDIDAKRFPYFVTKPSEEDLSDWLKRDGIDLILRSSIYRPDPKGPIERNEIQVRSVRTLLKDLPNGLLQQADNSWAWKATSEDVLGVFGAKDDAIHVVGFVPNAVAFDIRPDSPFLSSFRTASNLLGILLLEQPNSIDDELKLRIAYAANKDTPLDDLSFGPGDFVSGIESLEQQVVRKNNETPFVAKFPNEVRVEFVGLSRGVGDIKAADKWWRPDGSPLEQAPEHRGVSGVLKEGEVESDNPFVRTVIHVHGIGDNDAVTATAAMQIADSMKDESGGQYVAHHGYADASGRTRTFEVGVATDAPSPKRWLDRDGKRIEPKAPSIKDLIAEDITIEKVGPESWGKGANSKGGMTDPVGPGDQKMGSLSGTTQVTIRFPLAWRNVDLRLFAIDKSGNSHAADFTITLDPNDENADYKRLAKVIPLDYSEVDHFEYQFRVYRHWAIFENVSLWKGKQTEVAMKSETISKTSPASTSADKAKHSAAGVLPNGDTVVLMHLARAARWGITGKRVWWKPDGTLDEETNATEVEPEMIRRIANDRRLFAVHVSSTNPQPSIHLKTIPPMKLEHSVYADFTSENGKPARSLSGQFGPADTEKQITLQVGVTSEPWGAWQDVGLAGEPLVPFDDKQNYAEFYRMIKVISAGPFLSTIVQPPATVPLLGEQPVGEQSASNWVSTVVTLQWPEDHDDLFAFEFRAVDTDGATNYANGSTGTDNSGKTQFWFNGDVLREKLTKYQFRLRPYRHWVTFEDVANQAGVQTNPKVGVQAAPAINSTAIINEPQPANATVVSDSANRSETRKDNKPHRVIDAQGNPVAGAKIDCLPSMKYSWQEAPKSLGSTVTDSDGRFDYPEDLPFKERFYVYVSSDGFLERVFQANNGEAYVLENGIRKPDTLALRRPVTISGRLIGVDGKPLADAGVAVDYMFENGVAQINGNRVKSDAEGRFVAKGIEPANVFVRYEIPFKTDEERMPVGTQPGKLCIVAFTATDGQQKDDIVLDLSKCNCVVDGRIVDHEDKGVPNRWIQATIASAKGRLDESITVKSDADGRFRFEGLTADDFVIGTYTPSFGETVKLSPDKPAVVRLTTYVQGKVPLANETNPPIFGKPSDSGIVGGIRVQGGVERKLGEVITAEVIIKNTSDQVKMFAYSFAEHANLHAFEADKAIAELNYSHFTGTTVTMHYRLEPNQEAVVGSFQCGLHDPDDKQNGLPKATFQIPCLAGQTFKLRCDMSANPFGRTGDDNSAIPKDALLSTGTLSMKVISTNALSQAVRDKTDAVSNRGTLRGRFVFDGIPPTSMGYFDHLQGIEGSKPQQPGPDGRRSGIEALYREFLAKGIRPETKAQNLVVGNDSGVANIYVWAISKNIPWEIPAEGLDPVNVEFRDGKLTRRCFHVVTGQKLQFMNSDPVDHSVSAEFMKARNSSFNILVKPQSKYQEELSFPVAESLPTRLGLALAPWASGVLFVHSNPYVAITQSDGTFEIQNLPVGEWEFQVWHETAGYLLPNKGVFKHTIVEGENNLSPKLLKPEAFGIREAAKAAPVKPENREQIGTVQGKPVYRDEIVDGNLMELFTKPIWMKYKQEHREEIEPTEKELEAARSYFSQQHLARLEKEGGESKFREQLKAIEDKLADGKLSEEEANKLEIEHSGVRSRLRPLDPYFANFILDNWKLQKHLYENFGGGRILWQQAGQEAFDAMRTWLELQEKNGEFQITDLKVRIQFYMYWNQDHGAFLTNDEKRIREEFLQPPWVAVVSATDNVSQNVPSSMNAKADIEKTVLGILRKPFIDDPAKGTWQLGAHEIDVQWKLSDIPQRTEVIITLFKVVDRSVPSTMDERRLAMQFLSGADPTNLVPRLNKELENAIANPARPFAAYHEIEMLGRLGEYARSSLPLLIKLLDSKDGVAYNLALDSLIKIGPRSPDVMNELAKHTEDPITVYQLGRYGQMAKAHGPLFVKLLDSPSDEIHTWAAKALVKTGFDETRGYNVLIADVAAGKSENRCRAATALAALGSQAQEMIPRLRPFENDPDPQVAKAVRESIVRIEKDDRIFTHAEEATKREKALEASAALNPQIPFNLRIVGGEEATPIAGIEIVATNGYGESQKKFGPFLTDASGTTMCKLPQGSYTLHLKSDKEHPFLPYEKYWNDLPPPGLKPLYLRVTGTGVEKWLGGEVRENGVEPAKSQDEPARITFTLLKPIELILRAVDKDTGRGLPGATFYLESAAAEDWAHPIDGANIGASQYRDGEHKFDPHDYQTDADGYFKRFISDGYLRRPGDSDWGPKFGVWKSPEGYEVVEPKGEVDIDFPADNRTRVEQVFYFRRVK